MGPEARPALPAVVAVLSPGYDQTKGYVIEALAAADPRGEEVRPVLACLLDQPSSIVRRAAAVALAKVGDAAGARALGADLDSSETRTRVSAARELEHLRERGQPAREALLRHLASDPSADVRKACAAALPWIDPDSEAVVHALEAARQDPDEGVRAQLQISIPDLERAKGYRRLKAMPPGPP
jgi:HEAT repeat protein